MANVVRLEIREGESRISETVWVVKVNDVGCLFNSKYFFKFLVFGSGCWGSLRGWQGWSLYIIYGPRVHILGLMDSWIDLDKGLQLRGSKCEPHIAGRASESQGRTSSQLP